MNRNRLLEKHDLIAIETANQTTSSISPDRESTFSYGGLTGILLISIVSVAGFKILYRQSKLYLDRPKPLKYDIFKRLAQPALLI